MIQKRSLRRSKQLINRSGFAFGLRDRGCITAWMQSMPKSNNGLAVELFCWIFRRSGICYLLRRCLWRNRAAILLYHDPKPAVVDSHLEYLGRAARIVSIPDL